MLRITTQNDNQLLTFRLEGRLAGPWVAEFRDCWQSTMSRGRPPVVQVDLRAVTFVDAAGKELLAGMYRQGANLIANDCQMKAVVAEIKNATAESH
jgi:anti-anti-sigma regulatory factor